MSLALSNASTAPSAIPSLDELPRAVAVYCGANLGTVPAFQHAATCQMPSLSPNELRPSSTDSLSFSFPPPPNFFFLILSPRFHT
jgi:hypothetical protein